ncbi:uncharacterized protein LOC124373733 [Homalodisca vitripennis]|uniref:uncharacterized protein LOC124373733 n=1 Tax=Homalodisca vitripennis TaxID=197043 RepID=UPI001EEACC27|nr:uncharacterized protein LOC124373733 [Homalodisca vitripennis]
MDDRDDGVIQEWLLLPSSDISEEEEIGNEENEEDLVFDIIFNRGLEEQLEADGINLEEIRVAVSEGDNEFGDVEEQEAEDIQSASEIVTALPEEEDVSMADPDYMRPGPSTGRPIHRRGRGRRQENAPRVRRAVQKGIDPQYPFGIRKSSSLLMFSGKWSSQCSPISYVLGSGDSLPSNC